MMKDFKGKKIGVAARGTSSENISTTCSRDAGLKPEDVTYVAIGNPVTGLCRDGGRQADRRDHHVSSR